VPDVQIYKQKAERYRERERERERERKREIQRERERDKSQKDIARFTLDNFKKIRDSWTVSYLGKEKDR
jgi:F0F1-type ATP synthase epsilon subunit